MRSPTRLAVALLLAAAAPALALPTKVWRVTTYKDFDEGETEGALLSSLGDAASGYASTRIDIPVAQVFSTAVAAGVVYLGTGDQADLYAFDGKAAKKVVRLDGVLVSALVAAPDGTLYAGTLPGGKVWSVKAGVPKELCRLDGADQVWALVLDAEHHALLAATGPNGRIYSIDLPSGKSRVLWDSGEKHLLSMAREDDGSLLCGSAEEAILYRVSPTGVARAVHDFAGNELRAIARFGDVVYVAVNEFEPKTGTTPAVPSTRPHGTKMVLPPAPAATPQPAVPPGRDRKGKGAVYRIDADGRVEQLHVLSDGYFTALEVDRDGNLYAAAGANGRVYMIRPDRTVLTAFNFPERQILSLALAGPHPLIGTGDAGSIYAVDFAPQKESRWYSKVLDAGFPSRWGMLRYSSSGPLTVESRAGNTSRPDKTWSDWQAPRKVVSAPGGGEGGIDSPSGRYLQVRARLGKDARLRDVSAWYQPQNQRARVVEITVGEDPAANLAKAARAAGKPRSPVVKLKWKVENPDEDDLVFRLYYREESESNWKLIGGPDPLTAKEYDWNTEAVPDGNYLVKVVASDERANPKETALDHELLSTPFLIDNRKPEFSSLAVNFPTVSGTARDSYSPIGELGYSIDGGEWQQLGAKDGIFDNLVEEFTLRLPDTLAAGAHSVTFRAVDAADNVGLGQIAFRVKK